MEDTTIDFNERLQRAIDRGARSRDAKAREAAAKALSEEECKRLHSQYRLEVSEKIETCLQQLADHFPGFKFESVVGEKGWGAAISRDDIDLYQGQGRTNFYSRLEMVIRPYGSHHVLDLAAKGAIRNKEVFHRNQYQLLSEVDLDSFQELIDLWVLEYAELFAAKS